MKYLILLLFMSFVIAEDKCEEEFDKMIFLREENRHDAYVSALLYHQSFDPEYKEGIREIYKRTKDKDLKTKFELFFKELGEDI